MILKTTAMKSTKMMPSTWTMTTMMMKMKKVVARSRE
jgi:hypothetical protein